MEKTAWKASVANAFIWQVLTQTLSYRDSAHTHTRTQRDSERSTQVFENI